MFNIWPGMRSHERPGWREVLASLYTETMGIHKIIYGGQSLQIPLYITNENPTAVSGNVAISVYLSTDDDTGIHSDDRLLLTADNQKLNIAAGNQQLWEKAVTISSTLATGTYYIKTITVASSVNSVLAPNVVLNTRSLPLSDIDSMNAARAKVYEAAVTQAKISPDFVPLTIAPYGFTTAGFQSYIKGNEESGVFKNYPYLDSLGVPTIGWGFALVNPVRDSSGNIEVGSNGRILYTTNALAMQEITALGTTTYSNVINLAYANATSGKTTAVPGLTLTYGNAWFNQVYANTVSTLTTDLLVQPSSRSLNLSQLPGNIQAALIDMAYNMGPAYVNNFPKMLTYIKNNQLAFAGFELMDSIYATQLPNRATLNFRLLVSGVENQL